MDDLKEANKSFEDEDFTNLDTSSDEYSENEEETEEPYSDDESILADTKDKLKNKKTKGILKGLKKVNDDVKPKKQTKQKNRIIFNVSGNFLL